MSVLKVVNQLTKVTPYLISITSFIYATQFLYHTLISTVNNPNLIWVIFAVIISIFTFIGLRSEFYIVKATKINLTAYQLDKVFKSSSIVIGTTMATYLLATTFNTTTIFAASLICVLSTILFPKYQAEAYSGTVSGMIGSYLCEHWSIALFTGISTAVFFLIFKPYFKGVGGRGGSISYSASILVVRLILNLHPENNSLLENQYILPSLILIVAVAFITYYLHDKKFLTVVQAAMVTALIFEIIIPNQHYALSTASFAGTVIGMSTKNRVTGYRQLALISGIAFILYVPSYHILDGVGGKLGILNLLSYYSAFGLYQSIEGLRREKTRIN